MESITFGLRVFSYNIKREKKLFFEFVKNIWSMFIEKDADNVEIGERFPFGIFRIK
jgi:succinyl-CoA synthetase beta subunit